MVGRNERLRILAALTRLASVCPGKPERFSRSNIMYTKGDEDAPMFTEAWLYTAIGKDWARTVLNQLGEIADAVGADFREISAAACEEVCGDDSEAASETA